MTTIKDLKDLQRLIEGSSGKFLVFTRLDGDIFVICASDGYDLWRLELDPDEFETHRELADISMDLYLAKLKFGFDAGNITVSESGVKCTVRIGNGTNALSFELFEAKAVQKKTELQRILFHLASQTTDLEAQLSKANKTIEHLKQQKTGGAGGGMFDLGDAKKGKAQAKTAPKQAGMSVVNPGSRKRKGAKGVEFD